MFTRPNWRDKANYEWLLSESASLTQLAWEFLRRSPEYLECVYLFWKSHVDVGPADFLEFEDRLLDSGREFDQQILMLWSHDWARWWRMRRPATPSDDEGWFDFYSPIDDEPESFGRIDGGLTGSKVLMPVDLTLPLEVTFDRLKDEIRELRERGIRCELVKPRDNRVQDSRLYVQYLQILDAVHAGISFAEIGELLTPGAINDPVLKERDKRTRAAHVAALKVQQDGYKGLLERDPPFNKK